MNYLTVKLKMVTAASASGGNKKATVQERWRVGAARTQRVVQMNQ